MTINHHRNSIYCFARHFASTRVTIKHYMGDMNVIVTVVSDDQKTIFPNYIKILDENTVEIDFDGIHVSALGVIYSMKYYNKWNVLEFIDKSIVNVYHKLNTENVIIQIRNSDDIVIYPNIIYKPKLFHTTISFDGHNVSGKIIMVKSQPHTSFNYDDDETSWIFKSWSKKPVTYSMFQSYYLDTNEQLVPNEIIRNDTRMGVTDNIYTFTFNDHVVNGNYTQISKTVII